MTRSKSIVMLITAVAFAAFGARSIRHASATPGRLTREQIVKELGIAKPRAALTPEEIKAGYLALLKGDPNEKTIALTFDDGPHGLVTDRLLDTLRRYNVKATFFVVGKMAEKHPENVRSEAEDGHLVENHTYDHPCLDALTEAQVSLEYARCSETIFRLTGREPHYCRPPGGDFDPAVLHAATELGLTTTLWTDDPGDYRLIPEATIAARVIATARPGGIILLHDGIRETIEALPAIIDNLRSRGFRFVSVDELGKESAVARHSMLAKLR